MQQKIKKFLIDIDISISSIEAFLGSERDFNKYLQSKILRRAVERELEIIGEAMNQILKIDPEIKVSDSKRIVGLRNLIIHGYDNVDDIIIWGVVQKYIPVLKKEIKRLLKEHF